LGVTCLQFRLVTRALVRLEVPPWTARGVTCLVTWTIYPLTNLYTRAAVPEYVGTALLTCLLATWFLLIRTDEPAERRRLGFGVGLLFVLVAGTHPITALYSVPILILLIVAAFSEHGRDSVFWRGLVKVLAVPVALAAVVLAPWVYVVAHYRTVLHISENAGPWFYADVDRWPARFYPIPHDHRLDRFPIEQVPTPHLDAQLNVALLILLFGWVAVLLVRNRAAGLAALRSIVIPLIAFAFFLWISLYRSAFDILPSIARTLQIAYRAITYQNLALLLGVFLVAASLRRRGERISGKGPTVLLIAALALSAVGVVIMWGHAAQNMTPDGSAVLHTTAAERLQWAHMPPSFYPYDNYATPPLFTAITPSEREHLTEGKIPIGDTGDDDFGIAKQLRFTAAQDGWMGTNVQAFPWNHVVLDGTIVTDDHLRVDNVRLVIWVAAGEHTLEMETVPDPTWLVLRDISFAVLAAWLVTFAYLTYRRRTHVKGPPPTTLR